MRTPQNRMAQPRRNGTSVLQEGTLVCRTAQLPWVRHEPRLLPTVALPSSQASSSSASSQQKRKSSQEGTHQPLQQLGREKLPVPSTHCLGTGIVSVATSETKEARKCDQVMFLGRGKELTGFDMQSVYKRTFS